MFNPVINSAHSSQIYNLLYLAAFFTITALFIFSALQKKYPFQILWLFALAGAIFFITGNKLFAIPPQDWQYLLTDPASVSHGSKTMIGGLIGLILGSVLVIRWLKLDARIIDHAAAGLPVALAITRLGCLFSGCCYGTPSALPWAICYSPGSHAFDDQLAHGIISSDIALSLPVHPVQVYDIILCLLIALVVWKSTNYFKAKGNLLLLSVLLYFVARFILEFFRAPATDFYAGGTWCGIKYIQWILVAVALLLSMIIIFREKRGHPDSKELVPDRKWTIRPVSLLFFTFFVYAMLFNWFDPLEKTTIGLLLIPALIMFVWKLIGNRILPGYRLITSMILISGLCFMGQTYIPENDSTKVSFFEVGVGGVLGKYYTQTGQKFWAPATSGGTDCNGQYYPPEPAHFFVGNIAKREHSFHHYGTGVSYTVRTGPYKSWSTGLNGFYGIENESYTLTYYDSLGSFITQVNNNDIQQFAVNPFVTYDLKNIGFELGFHVGNFRVYNKRDDPSVEDPVNNVPTMHFLPQFGLRIGPQHIIYFDAHYCSAFPTCFPASMYSIGLASGLGFRNGTKLAAGYGSCGYYSTATIVIKEKLLLDVAFTYDLFSAVDGDFARSLSFGLHYRFGHKTVNTEKGK
jgi:prolipoprotein diacylglyceryltransferase